MIRRLGLWGRGMYNERVLESCGVIALGPVFEGPF